MATDNGVHTERLQFTATFKEKRNADVKCEEGFIDAPKSHSVKHTYNQHSMFGDWHMFTFSLINIICHHHLRHTWLL